MGTGLLRRRYREGRLLSFGLVADNAHAAELVCEGSAL